MEGLGFQEAAALAWPCDTSVAAARMTAARYRLPGIAKGRQSIDPLVGMHLWLRWRARGKLRCLLAR